VPRTTLESIETYHAGGRKAKRSHISWEQYDLNTLCNVDEGKKEKESLVLQSECDIHVPDAIQMKPKPLKPCHVHHHRQPLCQAGRRWARLLGSQGGRFLTRQRVEVGQNFICQSSTCEPYSNVGAYSSLHLATDKDVEVKVKHICCTNRKR
jgi:hypothetical protein